MSEDESDLVYVDKDGNASPYDLLKLSPEERLKLANRRVVSKRRAPTPSEADVLKECGLTEASFYKLSPAERLKITNRAAAKLKAAC